DRLPGGWAAGGAEHGQSAVCGRQGRSRHGARGPARRLPGSRRSGGDDRGAGGGDGLWSCRGGGGADGRGGGGRARGGRGGAGGAAVAGAARGGASGGLQVAERVAGQLADSRLGPLAGKISAERLQSLATNPNAMHFLDTASGHTNVVQLVEGRLLRITI